MFFQKEEGDIHPTYPNILTRNDSLDLPLKPLTIVNEDFAPEGENERLALEEVPTFRRLEVNGQFVYMGSKGKAFLYYNHAGKLIKKSKREPFINLYGQFIQKENSTFYLFDFDTEQLIDTIRTVVSIDEEGYRIHHGESLKELPCFSQSPFPPERNQYAHDSLFSKARYKYSNEVPKLAEKFLQNVCKANETYIYRNPGDDYSYYIIPKKKIAIAAYHRYRPEDPVPTYHQSDWFQSNRVNISKDFQLTHTEQVVHSLYGGGGRNFILLLDENILHYYDFIAEGDTLRFKSFRKLNLLETSETQGGYILVLGELKNWKNRNYFFKYTPKAYRKSNKNI